MFEMTSRLANAPDMSDGDLNNFIQEVYADVLDPFSKKFSEAISQNARFEEIQRATGMLIDTAHMLVATCLRSYSKDASDANYLLSKDKVSHLKKAFFDAVAGSNGEADVFQAQFCLAFYLPIKNAQQHRQYVQSRANETNPQVA